MNEIVPAALAGQRLDRVVAMLTGVTRALAAELLDAGRVELRGAVVTKPSARVAEGDELRVDLPVPEADEVLAAEPTVDVPVVHADEHVLVVDKPEALVVHPGAGNATGTLAAGLLARYPELAGVGEPDRPGIVHRLDKGTSGLLVVARTTLAYDSLVEQLSSRTVERRYLALVWGQPEPATGLVDAPIGRSRRDPTRMAVSSSGKEARTRYELQQRFTHPVDCSLLECRLETGRTHQIRVHLAAIEHPIVGDPRYRGARSSFPTPRPFLHAHALAFSHPATGERLSFTSPLPEDLAAVLARCS